MYPFKDRAAWFLAGRYAHLVKALDRRRGLQDSVLEARLEAMRFWNRIRAVVVLLLSLGLATAAGSWIARYMPAFDEALEAVDRVTATASALSGLLTVVYIFLTRLLGQIEADMLAILTLDRRA